MKSTLLVLLLSNLLISCAFFSSKTPQDFELLSGEERIGSRSKVEVEKELTIFESQAMNTFKVHMFPVIPEYLEKFKEVDDLLKEVPDPKDRTCFIAQIVSDSTNPKAIDLKTWKAEAMDDNDDFIDMKWTENTLNSKAKVTIIPSYHGTQKRFEKRGILCAVDKLNTAKYFQVKLSPEIVQWPLKGDLKFHWRVPYKTVENGEVVIKRRKKKIQKYKGW